MTLDIAACMHYHRPPLSPESPEPHLPGALSVQYDLRFTLEELASAIMFYKANSPKAVYTQREAARAASPGFRSVPAHLLPPHPEVYKPAFM